MNDTWTTRRNIPRSLYQLLQQQIALSSNGNETPHQAESTAAMLEHLERSMTRFHEHQTETLSVHERHLKNQAEFSETSIQLLQQQYALLTNGHDPHRNVELSPAVPAVAKDLFPVAPVARPQVGIPIPAPTQVAPVVATKPLTHESSWHGFRHRSRSVVQGADRGSQRKDGLSGRDARTGHGHGGRFGDRLDQACRDPGN